MEAALQTFLNVCVDIALKLVASVIVFLVGKLLISLLLKLFPNGKKFTHLDPTVRTFFNSFIKIALYAVLAVIIVGIMGVPMASVITLFATAGAAVALAVQGSFSNFVGGIMLLIFRPVSVGEAIDVGGNSGTVEEVGFFYTRIKTFDGVIVNIPNSMMTTSVVTNYSRAKIRRVDVVLSVSYGSDLEKVKSVIAGVIESTGKALSDPAPFIRVTEMSDSSIDFTVRVWTEPANLASLKSDIYEKCEAAFNVEGIEMPYPQLDVHVSAKKDN